MRAVVVFWYEVEFRDGDRSTVQRRQEPGIESEFAPPMHFVVLALRGQVAEKCLWRIRQCAQPHRSSGRPIICLEEKDRDLRIALLQLQQPGPLRPCRERG